MKLSHDVPPGGTVRDWLDARAQSGGTAFVFTDDTASVGWRELRMQARAIAGNLTSRGVAKGASVAILHPNGRDGLLALYGALYGGFRATMINLAAGPDAIGYALEHSEAQVAYVHSAAAEVFEKAKPAHLRAIPLAGEDAELHDITPEDHALLMYTSGTTGRPKGVVHSHASLLAGVWTTAVAHALTPEDRGFCVLPIYHINGLCVTVMGTLVSGG